MLPIPVRLKIVLKALFVLQEQYLLKVLHVRLVIIVQRNQKFQYQLILGILQMDMEMSSKNHVHLVLLQIKQKWTNVVFAPPVIIVQMKAQWFHSNVQQDHLKKLIYKRLFVTYAHKVLGLLLKGSCLRINAPTVPKKLFVL